MFVTSVSTTSLIIYSSTLSQNINLHYSHSQNIVAKGEESIEKDIGKNIRCRFLYRKKDKGKGIRYHSKEERKKHLIKLGNFFSKALKEKRAESSYAFLQLEML